jgi:hypothetical protein
LVYGDRAADQTENPHEEFDYQALLDALSRYSRPRDKISDLIRKAVILRVKKGAGACHSLTITLE